MPISQLPRRKVWHGQWGSVMTEGQKACAIEGVFTVDLRVIPAEKGAVLHMLRADAPFFSRFGEVYFSEIEPNTIKAWKMHQRQTQRLTVPMGLVQVVLFDARPQSPSYGRVDAVFLGREEHYKLLHIPPYIWYGFKNVGKEKALICNCTDMPHEASESCQKAEDDASIPYIWT